MRSVTNMILAIALCAGPALAAEGNGGTIEELIKEVRALRQQVEQLEARVDKLIALVTPEPGGPLPPQDEGRVRRGPNMQALGKIQLPGQPSREEVRRYVEQIMALSARQNSASSRDPQVAMLRRVGPENLDILLDALRYPGAHRGMGDVYITQAVQLLARREHKELILDYLPLVHELASVVRRYGWAEDARQMLLAGLTSPTGYMPREWLQAVASLGDEEALAALKTHFIEGRQRETTFEVLRMTSGIGDLDELVAKAWQRAKNQDSEEALDMAEVAVGYGHEDALALLVNFLARRHDPRGAAPFARQSILAHAEARGTDAQIVTWYRRNRDRLYWDAESRRFRVRAEEQPPAESTKESAQ